MDLILAQNVTLESELTTSQMGAISFFIMIMPNGKFEGQELSKLPLPYIAVLESSKNLEPELRLEVDREMARRRSNYKKGREKFKRNFKKKKRIFVSGGMSQ